MGPEGSRAPPVWLFIAGKLGLIFLGHISQNMLFHTNLHVLQYSFWLLSTYKLLTFILVYSFCPWSHCVRKGWFKNVGFFLTIAPKK